MRKLLFALVATAYCLTPSYGSEKGNGGDVVLCGGWNMGPLRIELLDYYESRRSKEITFDASVSHTDFIHQLADVFEATDPELFQGFRREGVRLSSGIEAYLHERILSSYIHFDRREITNINDEGRRFLGNDVCDLRQVIYWRLKNKAVHYRVDRGILTKMDPVQVRGMIIHELLYITLKKPFNLRTSKKLRRFHRELMVRGIQNLDPGSVRVLLRESFLR
jgi:hypothetical protein